MNSPATHGDIEGMSVELAKAYLQLKGFSLRVVRLNGVPQIGTRDVRMDRVNVEVRGVTVYRVTGVG